MIRILIAAFAILLAPLSVAGDEAASPDHEIARDAVARKEVVPLAEVLSTIQKTYPGKVIEVELEVSDGVQVYEVELISEDGRLIEVEADAVSGALLGIEEED